MSMEGVHRPTKRNLLKEIRRETFEKSLVDKKKKGSCSSLAVGYPFGLLGTPAGEF